MIRFILGKLVYLVPTFFGITLVAFGFVRVLPGDPVLLMAGERGITPERYAQLSAQLGFDRPLWRQYLEFLDRLLHGDLGNSLVTKKPVLAEFLTLFPATVELGLCAILIAVLVGVPVGVLAAVKRGSWFDQTSMTLALVGFSMPIFWWGLLLIIFFSGILGWTPVSGRISLMFYFPPVTGFMLIDSLLSGQKGAFASAVSHLILPSVVLATIPLAVIARQTRSAMLEVMGEDYVRTARAKGLAPWKVATKHVFRNALIAVAAAFGFTFAALVSEAVVTETVFSLPGIGRLVVQSILRRDYPVIQGVILIIVVLYMVINLLVDLAYAWLDPRVSLK